MNKINLSQKIALSLGLISFSWTMSGCGTLTQETLNKRIDKCLKEGPYYKSDDIIRAAIKNNPGVFDEGALRYEVIKKLDYRNPSHRTMINRLEEILLKFPDSKKAEDTLLLIAWIYSTGLENEEKALEQYERLIEKYPNGNKIDEAHFKIYSTNLAIFDKTKDIKRLGKAMEEIEFIIANYPKSKYAPLAQVRLGDIYKLDLKDNERALQEYGKVAANYPEAEVWVIDSFFSMGQIFEWNNEDARALDVYKKAINIAKKSGELKLATDKAANMYNQLGDIENWKLFLSKGIRIRQDELSNPKLTKNEKASVLNDISSIYERMEDYNKAVSIKEIIVKHYSETKGAERALMDIGDIFRYKLKNYEKSIEHYQKLVNFYPGSYLAESAKDSIKILKEENTR